jgi:phage tail sheath protein FI
VSSQTGVPGVTFTEIDESQAITGAASDIGAMLGVAERGVPNKRKTVRSWRDFLRFFGTFLASGVSDLAYAAKRALDGGAVLDITRIVHLDGSGDSTAVAAAKTLQTAGGGVTSGSTTGTVVGTLWQGLRTWALGDLQTAKFKLNGGGNNTGTVNAGAASKKTSAGNWNVNATQTITYKTSAGGPVRTITLSGAVTNGAVTPQQLANEIADQGRGIHCAITDGGTKVQIVSDQLGSGAYLEFTGGSALAGLGLLVEVLVGSGNVADVDHVTIAEMQAILDGAAAGITLSADSNGHLVATRTLTGAANSFQFVNGGATDAAFLAAVGLDTNAHAGTSNAAVDTLVVTAAQNGVADPGKWGENLKITSANATKNPATRFKWTLKYKGSVVGTEDELSMDPADDRYVVKAFANHPYIMVTDLDAYGSGGLGSYATARPAAQSDTALTGGNDGLAGLVAADYQGDSVKKTGFYAYDADKAISFVGTPGYTDRATAAALISYCASRGNLLAVLDVPPNLTPSQVTDWRQATGAYAGQGAAFNSSYGAAYDDRIKITDPLTSTVRAISPMGDVFAAYAKSKIRGQATPAGAAAGPQGGVLAAGTPPVLGLEQDRDLDTDGATLLQFGVNPIVNDPVYGIVIWGERNLQSTPSDMDRVPQRRWENYAKQSLGPFLTSAALFQPNDATTWQATVDKVNPWLRKEVAKGAISAGYLQNDAETNPAQDVAAHKMNPKLYVKHSPHAEFIEVSIINVSQDTQLAPQ